MNRSIAPQPHRRLLYPALRIPLLAFILPVAFATFLYYCSSALLEAPAVDFGSFYVAAHVLKSKPALLYDPGYASQVSKMVSVDYASRYLYFPLFLLPFQAIIGIPFTVARLIWLGINICLALVGVWIALRIACIPVRSRTGIACLGLAFLFPPLLETLMLGQTNLLLLVMIGGAILLLGQASVRWPALLAGCFLLALATSIKIFPGVLLIFFILHRRWRPAVVTVLMGVALILLSVLICGLDANLAYLQIVHSLTNEAGIDIFAPDKILVGSYQRQSLGDFIFSIFAWNGLPGKPILPIVIGLLRLTLFAVLVLRLVICKIPGTRQAAFSLPEQLALSLPGMLLMSSILESHHLTLLLLPGLVMLSKGRRVMLALLLALAFTQIDLLFLALPHPVWIPWPGLFAVIVLYGGVIAMTLPVSEEEVRVELEHPVPAHGS